MFYYLSGTLALVQDNLCVVDCAGVGYQLTVSALTASLLGGQVGSPVKIFTHLAVREDAAELFGFSDAQERACFHRLTSVSGVGPKAAMSILGIMTPDTLALALATEDTKAISRAPGVGSKTAARIVLELRDKISKDMVSVNPAMQKGAAGAVPSGHLAEAAEALVVLGYEKSRVLAALRDIDPRTEVGDIIRRGLQKLSAGR